MTAKKQFGEYLDSIHSNYLSRQFNQRGLASLYGVSESTYARWRKGDILPQPTNFFQICDALEAQTDVPKEAIEKLKTLYDASQDDGAQDDTISAKDSQQDANSIIQEKLNGNPISMILGYLPNTPQRMGVLVLLVAIVLVVLISLSANQVFQNNANYMTDNTDWSPVTRVIDDITLVKVPPGCFTMGSLQGRENERPTSRICFDEPYWIAQTETTIGQFGSPPDEACNTNQVTKESLVNGTTDEYPRNCVTWAEGLAFCQARGMRLPTEAEWEYAASGPSNWNYPWGNDSIPLYAIVRTNYNDPAIPGQMLPAGSKPRDISWVGAFDMAGSLQEFTSTIYDTVTVDGDITYGYPYVATDGRESLANTGTSANVETRNQTTTLRVLRGGGFDRGIERATTSIRSDEHYDFAWNVYGFRCAMDDMPDS
jgi:formylglycine-generating enzyme required for sulfatase activity/transcriptional regulator with XRE-family HTH domain